MATLKETGENIFSNFLKAGQGVVTDLAKESLAKFQAALPQDLIAERQRIDSINGSGAPSTKEAMKTTADQTAFSFGDPLARATKMDAGNTTLWVLVGIGVVLILGVFKFK